MERQNQPEQQQTITALFTDISVVLLTNGWAWKARRLAAETIIRSGRSAPP